MDIVGFFADSNHGHCLRRIQHVQGAKYIVEGAYGEGELERPNEMWRATATLGPEGRFLVVNFHEKQVKHAKIYCALWCPKQREIHWEDGNVWRKLYAVL